MRSPSLLFRIAAAVAAFLPASSAFAASLFLVVEIPKGGLLIQKDDGQVYFLESGDCSLQVGDTVAVDVNSAGQPKISGKIIKGGELFEISCAIWNARPVSGRFKVLKALKDDDQVLGWYNGLTYLLTYGQGCGPSVKNYENKEIYINVSGPKGLDASEDSLVLPNGNTCAIKEVNTLDEHSIMATTCPPHSKGHPKQSRVCVCDEGYQPNLTLNSCIESVVYCPEHSTVSGTGCLCDDGYAMVDNRCVSYADSCRSRHGAHANGNASQCWCDAGYSFDSANRCVLNRSYSSSSSSSGTWWSGQSTISGKRCPKGTWLRGKRCVPLPY